MMNSELVKMSEDELKSWLRTELGSKWSERNLSILSEVLFKEYQSMNSLSGPSRPIENSLQKC